MHQIAYYISIFPQGNAHVPPSTGERREGKGRWGRESREGNPVELGYYDSLLTNKLLAHSVGMNSILTFTTKFRHGTPVILGSAP